MKLALPLCVALVSVAGTAAAQKVAPGLWEYSIAMKPGGAQADALARMQEQLARMPPDKRKQMDEMLQRQGLAAGGAPGQPVTTKVCITPEQAARDEVTQPDSNCKQLSKDRQGNTMRFTFACTGERQATGEGEYTFVSDKQHQGKVIVNTMVRGKPERMEMAHQGRWLATNCGDVKPRP